MWWFGKKKSKSIRRGRASILGNVVFLDVDGVIATPRQIKRVYEFTGMTCPSGEAQIDPACVAVLKEIVDRHAASVVITSTWRLHPKDLHDLMWVLAKNVIPVAGMIPRDGSNRGMAIEEYVQEHHIKRRNVLIIDDSTADLTHWGDRLLRTDPHDGLKQADIYKSDKILNFEE